MLRCVRVSRESFPTWEIASSYKTKPSLPSLNKQNLIVRGNIMLIWYSCSSYYWNSPEDNICNRINAFRVVRVLIQVSTPQSTLILCTHIPPVPLSSRLTNGITVLTGHWVRWSRSRSSKEKQTYLISTAGRYMRGKGRRSVSSVKRSTSLIVRVWVEVCDQHTTVVGLISTLQPSSSHSGKTRKGQGQGE